MDSGWKDIVNSIISFFKWANPGLFFIIFVFSIQLTANVCRRLNSNYRPLQLEATAQTTGPQPLPLPNFFFKWAIIPDIFFVNFRLFKTTLQFLQQINLKKCPSSIWCWDLNPQPSEHESPPRTTRPGLPHNLIISLLTTMRLN